MSEERNLRGHLRDENGRPLRYKRDCLRLLLGSEFNEKEPLLCRVLKFVKIHDNTPKGASSAPVRCHRVRDQRTTFCVCVFSVEL